MQSTDYKAALLQARTIMAGVPSDKHAALAAAHDRYMCFCGVYSPEPDADHVAEDRAAFPHLLVYVDGRPSLSDERCADFMVAVSGLAREWCIAWDEVAFAEEHGDDFVEKQIKLQESVRLEAEIAAALK